MKRLFIVVFAIANFILCLSAQNNKENIGQNHITIVFYNCENFFDTINDEKIKDEEFLPYGKKQWTGDKYFKKIQNLSKVLVAIDSIKLPDIIGLSEIENYNVLEDFIKYSPLSKGNYNIIHYNSSDPRGIDVALLYKPDIFKIISYSAIPVYYDSINKKQKGREIMYVKGLVTKRDTLHIFVNHWKSRAGGIKETEPKRIRFAITLKQTIDSIFKINPNANIISMGDYNDEPENISLKYYLKSEYFVNTPTSDKLYNLMFSLKKDNKGTHFYKGEWNVLDQFIVSGALLQKKHTLYVKNNKAMVFNPGWITQKYKSTNEKIPLPTYEGLKYIGGFSDHFPIYMIINISK
ncbi:MAG TPA: endonuclease [Bacteroidales bacterium]|nr:endonuclease [Bacteroidales bacterium]